MTDADVIIVGFRCAGAPLAFALQRAGVKVIVVDRDPLFSNQPISTHAIAPYGMMMLDRLGLGSVVRALSPPCTALRFQIDDAYVQVDFEGTEMDCRAPRRSILDPALQKAAIDAGVDARAETVVTSLLQDRDRACGVRVKGPSGEYELRAPLVVGADGRNSAIARMTGAKTYLESESENGVYWSYFEKTRVFDDDPNYGWGACIQVEQQEARAIFQTDSDLLLLGGGGPRKAIDGWRKDPEASLLAHLRAGRLTAPLLEGSKMVEGPVGILSMHFYMKQAVGPGWALVGDAGLHIDPTPGLGISDAVRDAFMLSEAIIDGSENAMNLYWRQRDAVSIGLYHFAGDMSAPDYNNPLSRMIFDRVQKSPAALKRMAESLTRERDPFDVLQPTKLLRWLLSESLTGNFAPWSYLGRNVRLGARAARQQSVLDRALAKAERGEIDTAVPALR